MPFKNETKLNPPPNQDLFLRNARKDDHMGSDQGLCAPHAQVGEPVESEPNEMEIFIDSRSGVNTVGLLLWSQDKSLTEVSKHTKYVFFYLCVEFWFFGSKKQIFT